MLSLQVKNKLWLQKEELQNSLKNTEQINKERLSAANISSTYFICIGGIFMEVALMYDFDGTLSPLNMQDYNFIPALDMDSASFWKEVENFKISKNMDPVLAYMYIMIKKAKEKDISITKKSFSSYGEGVELFDGVFEFFDNINEYGKSIGINIKHYIISSVIKEIIEGTKIKDKFERIYASSFLYDVDNVAIWPKTAINYTNKTQFIYRINKGILEVYNDMINEHMDDDKKKIKFENMIYFGDG